MDNEGAIINFPATCLDALLKTLLVNKDIDFYV